MGIRRTVSQSWLCHCLCHLLNSLGLGFSHLLVEAIISTKSPYHEVLSFEKVSFYKTF